MKTELINEFKRRAKRYFQTIRYLNVERDLIDWNPIENKYNDCGLSKLTDDIIKSYKSILLDKDENSEYFDNLLNYLHKARFLSKNLFYLSPSNVAAIDFILKNASVDTKILDYGCGLGNLELYLRKLGFKNTWGYDDFSQIKKNTLSNFLKNFNAEDIIISKENTLSLLNDIALCISNVWDRLDSDILKKEGENARLKYILIECDYAPSKIAGFKVDAIYNNLLVVFKRIDYEKN